MASPDTPTPKQAPTKEEVASLPPFEGLPLDCIVVPSTVAECASAVAAIEAAGMVGFDTESKPLFDVGAVSDGPHVVQFAAGNTAWLFQLHRDGALESVATLLRSAGLVKAGFGLSSDFRHIRAKLAVEPQGVVDLDDLFRERGYRRSIGVRAAVAIVFGQRLQKSKRQTTSNWARPTLDDKQMLYAANDAYAAYRVSAALASESTP